MQVEFRTNLGSRDAAAHSLDYARCTRGERLDVSDEIGAKLCKRGFATEILPAPVKLKSIPVPVAEVAEMKPVEIKTSEPAAKPKGNKKPLE